MPKPSCKSILFTPTFVISILASLFSQSAISAVVRNDISYQYFRDFAENKGQFTVGASNIEIKNKQNEVIGTMLPNVPMPDLRVAMKNSAVATTVHEQYIASVKHNGGYGSASFGHESLNPDEHTFDYLIVARNNHSSYDYHLPRLNKLITEVAPLPLSNAPYNEQGTNPKNNTYTDTSRFDYFVRVGSGIQGSREPSSNETTQISTYYHYLTGGAPQKLTASQDNWMIASGNVYDTDYGPMEMYPMSGDSGSPLLAYDKIEKRWVMAGVLASFVGTQGTYNHYTASRPDMLKSLIANTEVQLNNPSGRLVWRNNGNASEIIYPNNQKTNIAVKDTRLTSKDKGTERPSIDSGKTIHFNGQSATLHLQNNIDQGAGALYFHNNFTVTGERADTTWLGAGISVDSGKTVLWQVNNPQNDRLSKIGAGTLHINGLGENLGDISVGDGTVILDQRAHNNKQQAFNQVGIVSGRGTVVLANSNQVNPNNIYFGFRGGRLDLNGNSLNFNYIQNADEGARIVNHNLHQSSSVQILGKNQYTASDIEMVGWGNSPKTNVSLYEYNNPYEYRTDYFLLKREGKANDFFPTNATSSSSWEYLGSNKSNAIQTALDRKNAESRHTTFSGFLGETDSNLPNGQLNVTYKARHSDDLMMLDGGTNLNGSLNVETGKLLLSGRPVAHAYDALNGNQDVIFDDEWINRRFKATEYHVSKGAVFIVGRNVERVEGNFIVDDSARLHFGYMPRRTLSCIRSNYTGITSCDYQSTMSNENFNNLVTTQVIGNIKLNSNNSITLGKSHLQGSITGASNSQLNMAYPSQWTMTGNSHFGNLNMESGSVLTLNSHYEEANKQNGWLQFNSLILDGRLTGNGKIRYLTNGLIGQGDHITVNGLASGTFLLNVKNTGQEPNAVSPLSLLTLNHKDQNSQTLQVGLENGYVDLGVYRYILAKQNNDYRLYNPIKAAQQIPAEIESKKQEIELINTKISQSQSNISTLETTYNQKKQVESSRLAQLNSANSQLQKAEKEANDIKGKRFRLGYIIRWRRLYNEALKVVSAEQTKVNQAKHNHDVAKNELNSALQALEKTRAEIKAMESSRQNIEQWITQQSQISVIQQAQQLCMNNGLSESVCHLVVQNASGDEDLTPTEYSVMEKSLLVEEATEALELAQANLTAALTSGNSESIEKARAEVNNATNALEQAKNEEASALLTALSVENTLRAAILDSENTTSNTESIFTDTSFQSDQQADLIGRYANAALSEFSASVNNILQVGQNLDRHLLSEMPEQENNVWVNTQLQKNIHHSENFRRYKQRSTLTQLGVSKTIEQHSQFGAVLSHLQANNDFADNINGKSHLLSASLYAKHLWNNGLFASLDSTFSHNKSQISSEQNGKVYFHRNVMSVGLNTGYQWKFAMISIQPSIGARYHRFNGTSYQLDGADIQIKPLNLMTYNAGLKLSGEFNFNDLIISPNVSIYYHDATKQNMNVNEVLTVNDTQLNQQFGRYTYQEAGLSMKFNHWLISGSIGAMLGSDIDKQKYANFKLSYQW